MTNSMDAMVPVVLFISVSLNVRNQFKNANMTNALDAMVPVVVFLYMLGASFKNGNKTNPMDAMVPVVLFISVSA